MRIHFLLLALLLPAHLAVSSSQSAAARLERLFHRRTSRSSPFRVATSPRQHRYSRYVREPEQQQHEEMIQQQEKAPDDTDVDINLEQLLMNHYGQPQQQPAKSHQPPITQQMIPTDHQSYHGPLKSTPAPLDMSQYDISNLQNELQQMKDDDSPPITQQQQQKSMADDFDGGDLSQKYMPTSHQSYSPMMQQRQTTTPQSPMQQQKMQNGAMNGNGHENHAGSSMGQHQTYSDYDQMDDMNSMEMMKDSIQGEPGKDYPIYSQVPMTSFKCSDHQYPGYYADVEAQCQVFHICQPDGRHNAFLCPNGTIFSQRHFVCVWWYEVDCAESAQYFDLNADLYKESPNKHSNGNVSPAFESDDMNGGGYSPAPGGGRPNGGYSPSGRPSPMNAGYTGDNGYGTNGVTEPSTNQFTQQHEMYQTKMDGFPLETPITTSAPVYSSVRRAPMSKTGKMRYSRPTNKPLSKYEPSSYADTGAVTPSPIVQETYETTPYNLDAALGEERETPLIESLPLTTILPHVEQAVDMAMANQAATGFNGKMNMDQYYSTKAKPLSSPSNGGYSPKKYGSSNGSSKGAYSPMGKGTGNGQRLAPVNAKMSYNLPASSPATTSSLPASPSTTLNGGGAKKYSSPFPKSSFPSYGTKI